MVPGIGGSAGATGVVDRATFRGRTGRIDHAFITLAKMTLVVVVVAVVVAVATYLTWLARRLDRLGVRVDAARAGLVVPPGEETCQLHEALAVPPYLVVGQRFFDAFPEEGLDLRFDLRVLLFEAQTVQQIIPRLGAVPEEVHLDEPELNLGALEKVAGGGQPLGPLRLRRGPELGERVGRLVPGGGRVVSGRRAIHVPPIRAAGAQLGLVALPRIAVRRNVHDACQDLHVVERSERAFSGFRELFHARRC